MDRMRDILQFIGLRAEPRELETLIQKFPVVVAVIGNSHTIHNDLPTAVIRGLGITLNLLMICSYLNVSLKGRKM